MRGALSGRALGVLNEPRGVAVDAAGRLFVADAASYRLDVFSAATGAFAPAWVGSPTTGGDDVAPGGGRRRSDQRRGHRGRRRARPDAPLRARRRLAAAFGGSGAVVADAPSGAAINPAGDTYVADTGDDRIVVLSPTGTPLVSFGSAGSAPGQFNGPTGVALDRSATRTWSTAATTGCRSSPPREVHASVGRLRRAPGQFLAPAGLAVAPSGVIYVADSGNDRIEAFAPRAQFLDQWGANGSDLGEFGDPTGVAVDAQGSVYVADTGNNRVERFDGLTRP